MLTLEEKTATERRSDAETLQEIESLRRRVESLSNDAACLPLLQPLILALVVLVFFLFGSLIKCNLMLSHDAAELAALRHALTERGVYVGEPRYGAHAISDESPASGNQGLGLVGVLAKLVAAVSLALLQLGGCALKYAMQTVIQLIMSFLLAPILIYALARKGSYKKDFEMLRTFSGGSFVNLIPMLQLLPVDKVFRLIASDRRYSAEPAAHASGDAIPIVNISGPHSDPSQVIDLGTRQESCAAQAYAGIVELDDVSDAVPASPASPVSDFNKPLTPQLAPQPTPLLTPQLAPEPTPQLAPQPTP